MDITDVQLCADYFKQNYLETFYLITTYSDKIPTCTRCLKLIIYSHSHKGVTGICPIEPSQGSVPLGMA